MVICFTKQQKIELNRYLESVGINYFCYNIATDTGFVFKCDDDPKYSEEFLSYNLHNNLMLALKEKTLKLCLKLSSKHF